MPSRVHVVRTDCPDPMCLFLVVVWTVCPPCPYTEAAMPSVTRKSQTTRAARMAAVIDASAYDPSVREGVAEMMNRNVGGLRHHIREGQKAGFVDPKLLPQETAEWLAWMAERGIHQLIRTAKGKQLERLVDAYTDIVWNTLYAPVLGAGGAGREAKGSGGRSRSVSPRR